MLIRVTNDTDVGTCIPCHAQVASLRILPRYSHQPGTPPAAERETTTTGTVAEIQVQQCQDEQITDISNSHTCLCKIPNKLMVADVMGNNNNGLLHEHLDLIQRRLDSATPLKSGIYVMPSPDPFHRLTTITPNQDGRFEISPDVVNTFASKLPSTCNSFNLCINRIAKIDRSVMAVILQLQNHLPVHMVRIDPLLACVSCSNSRIEHTTKNTHEQNIHNIRITQDNTGNRISFQTEQGTCICNIAPAANPIVVALKLAQLRCALPNALLSCPCNPQLILPPHIMSLLRLTHPHAENWRTIVPRRIRSCATNQIPNNSKCLLTWDQFCSAANPKKASIASLQASDEPQRPQSPVADERLSLIHI